MGALTTRTNWGKRFPLNPHSREENESEISDCGDGLVKTFKKSAQADEGESRSDVAAILP